LPIYGKGKNRIPTVHIADLVTYVEKIVEKRPKIPYLLALDHNPKPTQRKIIEAISKGIGTGLVESKNETYHALCQVRGRRSCNRSRGRLIAHSL
jgi:hypothetical protein